MPNDWLRLPDGRCGAISSTASRSGTASRSQDTNHDGLRENTSLDRVMRDWLQMLSLGFYVTPAGNSDTHTTVADPVGMPRTYVRVADDSAAALAVGAAVAAVVQTQTGANSAPRDIVVTDGPMIAVTVGGQPAIGRQVPSTGGRSRSRSRSSPPTGRAFDTLEVFANTTPDGIKGKDAVRADPAQVLDLRDLARSTRWIRARRRRSRPRR